jgi:hypothetical protein
MTCGRYFSCRLIVREIRSILKVSDPLPDFYSEGFYAAHVVAASVIEVLQGSTEIPVLFERMICILKTMHDKSPSWGPLYAMHPGDIVPLQTYLQYDH